MNIKIAKGKLQGTVHMISSKSDAHRLLIAAALADAPTEILLYGVSEDIEATMNCLNALGADCTKTEKGILVKPIEKNPDSVSILNCNESGSTLRFMLPIAAALGKNVLVEGKGRLPERPISLLTELISTHGCYVSQHQLPLEISGQLQGGVYELPGDVSSQFITGLLLSLPILSEDSEIRVTSPLQSRGYVNMTLHALETFGIKWTETETGFLIKGNQQYQSPKTVQTEGDWSNAAFWLSAAAIKGEVTCEGIYLDSYQSDKQIFELLQQFGAQTEVTENGIKISEAHLKGCKIDVSQIPDLAPILCIVAAAAEGTTELFNGARLRLKESDRIQSMGDCLRQLGADVEELPDAIIIHGGTLKQPKGEIRIDGYNDHRVVMAAAIGAAVLGREATIVCAEAVTKSYPTFFAEFLRLGGGADVL